MNPNPIPAPLVLITGSSGSGKTTLAGLLQRELGYPLLQRDALKEVLLDSLGAASRTESRRLGATSWSLLYALLDQMAGRVPVIVESNFSRGRDEVMLGPLLARARPVILHCEAEVSVLERRIAARAEATDRHPGHFDGETWSETTQRLRDGAYAPLTLPHPTIRVDTSAGLKPNLVALLGVIRQT